MTNKLKLFPLFFYLFFVLTFAYPQDPYQLTNEDIWFSVGGMVTATASQLWLMNQEPFSAAEIGSGMFDPMDVNGIDRFATGRYSKQISANSDIWLISSYGVALGACSIPLFQQAKQPLRHSFKLGILMLEANCLTLTATNLFKGTFRRTRPFVYNPDAPLELKTAPDARHAFFSGHTSLAATNSFFAAKVFSDYFPQSKLKPFVWGAAIALPALVASQRVRAGKHYLTDVTVGYLVGAACGYLVPHRHRRSRKGLGMRVIPNWGTEEKVIVVQWRF